MGTRVDFYVGRGLQAEWLGSYPYDGYPEGIPESLREAKTEAEYRGAVARYLAENADAATLPAAGWPWPWDDSRTTDYAYAFDSGRVYGSRFGRAWFDASKPEPDDSAKDAAVFPDMRARKAVTLGPKSGLIVLLRPAGWSGAPLGRPTVGRDLAGVIEAAVGHTPTDLTDR